jgi:Mor family transcriptional regulator
MGAPVSAPRSLADRLFDSIATTLAEEMHLSAENRAAFVVTANVVMRQQFRSLFGGEVVRFYVPKADPSARQARDARIAASLRSGEEPTIVAQREQVSERHIRRVRGRIGDR